MKTILASALVLGLAGAAVTLPAKAADIGFSISIGDRHHYHGDRYRGYYWHEGRYWHNRHREKYCKDWDRRHGHTYCSHWGTRWTYDGD